MQQSEYDKLFVYGIFLSQRNRDRYGMVNPVYDTVKDYATVGEHVVEAIHVPNMGLALTGLVVDMPVDRWPSLDALEAGYVRREVTTVTGETAYMYMAKES